MERQQDTNLWAASAIYAAANSVLLLAFFSSAGAVAGTLLLAIIGLLITGAWAITARRAQTYQDLWIRKALQLQDDFGVPTSYSVWEHQAPPGVRSWIAMSALIGGFLVLWLILIGYSIALGGIRFG